MTRPSTRRTVNLNNTFYLATKLNLTHQYKTTTITKQLFDTDFLPKTVNALNSLTSCLRGYLWRSTCVQLKSWSTCVLSMKVISFWIVSDTSANPKLYLRCTGKTNKSKLRLWSSVWENFPGFWGEKKCCEWFSKCKAKVTWSFAYKLEEVLQQCSETLLPASQDSINTFHSLMGR